jgi:MFS family permease
MLLGSVSGVAFEHLGLRRSYLISTLLLGISLALLGADAGDPAVALVSATLFGAFYAAVIAAHGVWSAQVFDEHPAAGLAAVSTALTLGTLIGPVVAGVLVDRSGHALALASAAVISGVALPFCPPGTRRRAALAKHECAAAPVRAPRPTASSPHQERSRSGGAQGRLRGDRAHERRKLRPMT